MDFGLTFAACNCNKFGSHDLEIAHWVLTQIKQVGVKVFI